MGRLGLRVLLNGLVMRLILVGPPGSGKGTQAKLLSNRLQLAHIGTGDILREAVRQNTPLGKSAQPYILGGQLVPDDLVNDLVADRFRRKDRPNHFVLDGYPRNEAQAIRFDEVLRQTGQHLTAVLLFLVDEEEIVRRMTGRWSCPRCKSTYHLLSNPPKVPGICDVCQSELIQRSDDSEKTVRERLRVYRANTMGMVPYYKSQGLLREVSGIGSIEEIYQRILQALNYQAEPPC
jgi:adenylate kinase